MRKSWNTQASQLRDLSKRFKENFLSCNNILHFYNDTMFRKKKVEGLSTSSRTEEESVAADEEQGSEYSATVQNN